MLKDDVLKLRQTIAELNAEIESVRETLRMLLLNVGYPGECLDCHRPIVWVWHPKAKKNVAYDKSGVDHTLTCIDAWLIRQRTKGAVEHARR